MLKVVVTRCKLTDLNYCIRIGIVVGPTTKRIVTATLTMRPKMFQETRQTKIEIRSFFGGQLHCMYKRLCASLSFLFVMAGRKENPSSIVITCRPASKAKPLYGDYLSKHMFFFVPEHRQRAEFLELVSSAKCTYRGKHS